MPKEGAEFGPTPSADEVRAALERILHSEPFRPSSQLQVFLRFVVETTLAGAAERIRAFTIAVEAFGRDEDFNPQSDPIVRVEAARLRRAIEQYYDGPGADDPVEILVPRGGYVPRFRYRGAADTPVSSITAAEVALPPPPAPRLRVIRPQAMAAAFVLLLAGATAGIWLLRGESPQASLQVASAPQPSPTRSPLPVVLIDPLPASAASVAVLSAIRLKLADAMARFDDIEVVPDPSLAALPKDQGAPNIYRLTLNGERRADGTANLTVQLADANDGTMVWSRNFEGKGEDDPATAAEKIARTVVPTLAQPFGVIYARERLTMSRPGLDPRHRCLLEAIEYRRTLDAAKGGQHADIKRCLERIVATEPSFPSAQSALAFFLMREFYAGESRDPKGLDDALRLALRGVELRPASARAHHVLMNILFARGSVREALAEGELAISLNPYDMTALTGYAMRLAMAGRPSEAMVLLDRVGDLSPARPPMLEFGRFMVNYLLGDDARAAHHAGMLTDEIHPFVLIARALVAVKAGDQPRAQQAVDRLFTHYPHWRISPRAEIERYVSAHDIADRVIRDLSPVGFSTTN